MSRTHRIAAAVGAAALAATTFAPVANAQINTDSLQGPVKCTIEPEKVAAETPGAPEGSSWSVSKDSNLGGDLGYILLEAKGGTGSSPSKVLLYHRCDQTKTQPSNSGPATIVNSSNLHVLTEQTAFDAEKPNAEQPKEHWIYVWNPVAADATAVKLPY